MKAVCGLDVHKDSIYLCILHSDGELFEQVFGVLTFQLEEMCPSRNFGMSEFPPNLVL